MLDLAEAGDLEVALPGLQIVEGAVAFRVPAFLVVAAGIGTKERPAGLQCAVQFTEHPGQRFAGNVEQGRVRKDAVEPPCRQFELQKLLVPYLTAGRHTRHGHELFGAVEPNRAVAQPEESPEIPPRTAPKIEYRERRCARQGPQQRLNVLANVVIACGGRKGLGVLVVVRQGPRRNPGQVVGTLRHVVGNSRSGDGPSMLRQVQANSRRNEPVCGRYVSRIDAALERDWELTRPAPLFESYNIAPTTAVPVVRERDGERTCELIRWGLVPFWAKGIPPKLSTINARIETIATAPSYRGPWKRGQRCLLPALGFYEWQLRDAGKQPWFIHLADQPLFGLAGLWDASTAADGSVLESCTIITMPANAFMAEIHNSKARMPAILRRENHAAWLAGDATSALACLQPYPEQHMLAHTVSTAVNSPRNNAARLIEPAGQ